MKTRVTLSIIGLLLLALSASIALAGNETAEEAKNPVAQDTTQVKPIDGETKFIAYYVHGTRRCATCKKLESYTQEAIEANFADELKTGSLVWQPVNADEPGNEHYNKDYQLFTKAVVLSEVKDGKEIRWKNLDQIWTLVRGDKDVYLKYIRDEVTAFIGKS